MVLLNDVNEIDKVKHNQILKLVTSSFYKELVNYGVNDSDIITVSVNLLDYVTKKKGPADNGNENYSAVMALSDIQNAWQEKKELTLKNVTIAPLRLKDIAVVKSWLEFPEIDQTFIRFFPKDEAALTEYLIQDTDKAYFRIGYEDKEIVGIIGAENMDEQALKLEMKKLVGCREQRGKGIGKLATFLFLYYTFEILNYNKVYIHSLDTNIKNINLNSKFGFELEGILFAEVRVEDSFRDVLRMSLIRQIWEDIFYNGR